MELKIWDWLPGETLLEKISRLNKVYGQYRPFWKRLRRIIKDKRRYGYMGPVEVVDKKTGKPKIKIVPKHANSKRNPCPRYNKFAGIYRAWDLGQRMMVEHFYAEKKDLNPDFIFTVNDPTNPFPEMVVDIDGNDVEYSLGIARQIDQQVFGGKSFIEPSRGLEGAYNRFLVRRRPIPKGLDQQYEAARRFNRLMLLLGRILRHQFPKGHPSYVDNVKALLWCQKFRHSFAEYNGVDVFRKYEKSKHSEDFRYNESLERFILHRGVLATVACAGWAALEKEQLGHRHGRSRYEAYLAFTEVSKEGVPVNVVDEEIIQSYVEAHLGLLKLRDRSQRPKMTGASATHLCNSIGSTTPSESHKNVITPTINWDYLKDMHDTFARTRLTVIRLDKELGRCPTEEEVLAKWNVLHGQWEKDGFERSESEWDTPRRIHECVLWWKAVTEHRECPFAFEQQKYLDMVNQFIRPEMVTEAKKKARSRAKVTSLDLAITLYVITMNSLDITRRPEVLFGTPVEAIIRMFDLLKSDGLSRTSADKRKVRAMKGALEAAGLIFSMGPAFHDFSDPKAGPVSPHSLSCGEQFGLGPNHTDHTEFAKSEQQVHDAYQHVLRRRKAMADHNERLPADLWPGDWDSGDIDDFLGGNGQNIIEKTVPLAIFEPISPSATEDTEESLELAADVKALLSGAPASVAPQQDDHARLDRIIFELRRM